MLRLIVKICSKYQQLFTLIDFILRLPNGKFLPDLVSFKAMKIQSLHSYIFFQQCNFICLEDGTDSRNDHLNLSFNSPNMLVAHTLQPNKSIWVCVVLNCYYTLPIPILNVIKCTIKSFLWPKDQRHLYRIAHQEVRKSKISSILMIQWSTTTLQNSCDHCVVLCHV